MAKNIYNLLAKRCENELSEVRKKLISNLKYFATKHGKNGEIVFEKADLSFVQSNTEDTIYSFNSKGGLDSENEQDEHLEDLATDLLALIYSSITKTAKRIEQFKKD